MHTCIHTYIHTFTYTYIHIHTHTYTYIHIHTHGSKTVLTKIKFFKKITVLPQRGNDLCHWKSDKFGRPNLGVFWGNFVFTTVQYNFLLHFDRTKWGIFFFIRACATCLQSSGAGSCTYWRSAIATFWHIKWDLCAWHPKLLGWIVCSSYTQHQ